MTKSLNALDWSLVQAFLAVAETGSLSAAARSLRLSQPTIGRHIRTIEEELGADLFKRQARGMALTELGTALLDPARAMREAAEALSRAAAGGETEMAGTVRITASLFVSHHILPKIIAEIRHDHPEIQIDLVASDQSENLLFREADIAVRMYRPRQLDMVTRHVGDVKLGVFAAKSYLARRGQPGDDDTLMDHDIVGYDRNEEIIQGFRDAGINVDRSFFSVRTDNQTVYWELVRAGCGIGFSQIRAGQNDPTVEEIALPFDIPVLSVWLTAHEQIRQNPRVACVWDILARKLAVECDAKSKPS